MLQITSEDYVLFFQYFLKSSFKLLSCLRSNGDCTENMSKIFQTILVKGNSKKTYISALKIVAIYRN